MLLLLLATLLCSLTTGFVFAFAVVVMPGFRPLPDRDYLRAFKAIDRVIQNNDPLFMLVWGGSVLLLIAAAIINPSGLEGTWRLWLIGAVVLYVVGVQVPTMVVNVPLNNQLQATDLDTLDAAEVQQARAAFEPRWVFWNWFRTVAGVLTTGLLLVLLNGG